MKKTSAILHSIVLVKAISMASAQTVLPLPSGVEGTVSTMAALPDHRLIIGGNFTAVNGQLRTNLARLNADGSLDPTWNPPAPNNIVTSFVVTPNVIYVGGSFWTMGNETRRGLAALDSSTGQLLEWDPLSVGLNSNTAGIRSMEMSADGNTLYVSGNIDRIGPVSNYIQRRGFAAFDAVNGSLRSWYPHGVNITTTGAFRVARDQQNPNVVYTLGDFTDMLGVGCSGEARIAVVHGVSGQCIPWGAQALNNRVTSIAIAHNNIYLGGTFTSIGGQPRNGLAALRTYPNSAAALSWNPSPDGTVSRVLGIAYDSVFVAGDFTMIGGQPRDKVAQLPLSPLATTPTDWSVTIDNYPRTMAVGAAGTIFLGGNFTQVNGHQRYGIARVTVAQKIFENGFDGQ